MIKRIAIIIVLLVITFNGFSQEEKNLQLKEYATVYVKVFYQGNTVFYDRKGASKSPVMTLSDGKSYILENHDDPKNVKEYTNLNEILNYMAKYGWVLKSSNVLPYEGGAGNNSKSTLINTNHYFQMIIFEKEVK